MGEYVHSIMQRACTKMDNDLTIDRWSAFIDAHELSLELGGIGDKNIRSMTYT